jgi:hypothetical protein
MMNKQLIIQEGRPTVRDWNLEPILEECFQPFVTDLLDKALAIVFDESDDEMGPYLTMPAIWGPETDGERGPGVTDPLTIYVILRQLSDSTSDFVLKASLRDILSYDIESCAGDGSFAEGLASIAAEFRALADEISAAIEKAPK